MSDVEIRSYSPNDLDAIRRIHEASGIDYRMPNLDRFPVSKVLLVDGEVKAAYGMRHTVESHLWLERSSWTDAAGKWAAIKVLDREATEAAKDLGIDSILCCIPPSYERFGRRLKDLGFSPIRDGWKIYTKQARQR